jgi:hypothetical protein
LPSIFIFRLAVQRQLVHAAAIFFLQGNVSYWQIGREIVEEERRDGDRAA